MGKSLIQQGANITKAGAMVVAIGLGNPASDSVGTGFVAFGLGTTATGIAISIHAGDSRGAFEAALTAVVGESLPDAASASPTDPVPPSAHALTNLLFGPDPCS